MTAPAHRATLTRRVLDAVRRWQLGQVELPTRVHPATEAELRKLADVQIKAPVVRPGPLANGAPLFLVSAYLMPRIESPELESILAELTGRELLRESRQLPAPLPFPMMFARENGDNASITLSEHDGAQTYRIDDAAGRCIAGGTAAGIAPVRAFLLTPAGFAELDQPRPLDSSTHVGDTVGSGKVRPAEDNTMSTPTWPARPCDPTCKQRVAPDDYTICAIRRVISDWDPQRPNWEAVQVRLLGRIPASDLPTLTIGAIGQFFVQLQAAMIDEAHGVAATATQTVHASGGSGDVRIGGAVHIRGGAAGPYGPGAPVEIRGGNATAYGDGAPVIIEGGSGGAHADISAARMTETNDQHVALTEIQLHCLQYLVEQKALDRDARRNATEIASGALGPIATANSVARCLAELKRHGYLCGTTGRGGGYWLTERGKLVNGNSVQG